MDLLSEKRQIVFYGPPGTGKTFVALALCEHLTAEGGDFRLIQFHPSYSYEDFFEGYRPKADGGGVEFALTPGPLREIAAAADADPVNPYILVIDEINRGNIPKIFGELLFLLEYRDRVVQPQYSPQRPFALPPNLFLPSLLSSMSRHAWSMATGSVDAKTPRSPAMGFMLLPMQSQPRVMFRAKLR